MTSTVANGATLAAGLLLLSAQVGAQQPQPASTGYNPAGIYSLDEWMTMSSVGSFIWSPNGSHIFYTSDAADTGTDEIFRLDVRSGTTEQLTGAAPHEGPGPVAKDRPEPKQNVTISRDGTTLYYTSARFFQRMYNLYAMPVTGGTARQLTFHDGLIETDPAPSPDGSTLAYFVRTSRGTEIRLLDLNGRASWPRLLDVSDAEERAPVWSPDGSRIAMQRSGTIWIYDMETGTADPIGGDEYPGGFGSPAWSPDGSLVAVSNGASGFSQIGVIDLTTGDLTPITYEQRDHSSVSWSPDGQWLTFVRTDEVGMSREIVVAAADGSSDPRVLVSGKGVRSSPQFSPRGDSIAYIETTPNRVRDIWLIPATGGEPRQLTNSMGSVDPDRLSVPKEVFYPALDNLRIPALLYRPPDLDPTKKYPVIVALHGHPGQWNHSMNTVWQYFVQKGFVLIAPNPRGSRGFGAGFHDLHVGDEGGTEYEDVMGSLKYLATLPYVDMTRKASDGGSGGGYMSYTIAVHAPGVYMASDPSGVHETFQAQIIRVAASSRRFQPLERYISPGRFGTESRTPTTYRTEFGGPYELLYDRVEERSPLNYVERVTVPQLIMVGLRDGSVPYNGSRRWVQRMHQLGKGDLVEYIEYPDEDHSLSRYRSTVRDRLVRMERFLEDKLNLRQRDRVPETEHPPHDREFKHEQNDS